MKRWLPAVIGILGIFHPRVVDACSCIPSYTFCSSISQSNIIVTAKVIDIYEVGVQGQITPPLMDIVIQDRLFLDFPTDTITMIGQDGFNCNAGFYGIEVGDLLIIAFNDQVSWWYNVPAPHPFSTYNLWGCGVFYLEINDDKVNGAISEGVNQQPFNEFVEHLDQCLNITSVNEQTDLKYSFVPNPTSDLVTVQLEQPIDIQVAIYSLGGTLLQRKEELGNSIVLDLGNYAPGMYLMVVTCNGRRRTEKLVKI